MVELTSWPGRKVQEDLGKCLFTFAVVADTHVDREGLPSSSPFPVNALANDRTRYCVQDIKNLSNELGTLAPQFVLHLGDLIHPVPSMPTYTAAAQDFFNIVGDLEIPLYLLPGNHDVGDKPVDWAPAGVVRDEFLACWDEHFGAQYQSLNHSDCHFTLINAQVINSGLALETEQSDWLENDLAAASDQRKFLCLHYPPYLTFRDEPGNYDNLDEPGRTWILDLIERHDLEAVFTGHVHHFWYNRYAQSDWYLFPSTSFTRQDYSELFRDAPTEDMEAGRNDADKVGYFIVFVYEHGHVCHLRRTQGVLLPRDQFHSTRPDRIATYHSREATNAVLGFEMRHPWAEITEIAPSGALDEFHRKEIRNDYPLLALWDMGVRSIRIPIQDVGSPHVVERIRALKRHGHTFTVISEGSPSSVERSSLIENNDLIDRWELTLRSDRVESAIPDLQEICDQGSFPIYLSKLRLKEDVVRDGEPYFHLISHGFVAEDADELRRFKDSADFGNVFSGFVFRIGRNEHPWDRLPEFDRLADELGMASSATVFMADPNPALTQCDDKENACRIAEAMLASACAKTDVFVDTFMDLDRGHSVRNGVIDRRFNPRLGLHVVRHLHGVLNGASERLIPFGRCESAENSWIAVSSGSQIFVLLLSNGDGRDVELHQWPTRSQKTGTASLIDLATGNLEKLVWRQSGSKVCFDGGPTLLAPSLIAID